MEIVVGCQDDSDRKASLVAKVLATEKVPLVAKTLAAAQHHWLLEC